MKNNTVTSPRGFAAAGVSCGIKEEKKALDLGLLVAHEACPAAAVFTRNRFCGAPIVVGREHMSRGKLRAVVVNSGRANVATGERGIADARTMCARVSSGLGASAKEVLPASTGVIGEYLPMTKVRRGIDAALASLASTAAAGHRFARAILTTDTRVKQACERVTFGRKRAVVAGCCKGSGMIAPNMATMLGFLTTDVGVNGRTLRRMLAEAVEPTFNRVTVDECESTSDMVVIMASGAAGEVTSKRGLASFASALHDVCEQLAYEIAADGEGATRVIEVTVRGARTAQDAHEAARAIAVSPLVKTAVHGGDPNWGRIVQALGATDVSFRPERVTLRLDRTVLFSRGKPASRIDGQKVGKVMKQHRVPIIVDLGAGRAEDRVITCDLSRDYIAINADYHT